MKKNCCLGYFKWVIIQNQIAIFDLKNKAVLDVSNYAAEEKLNNASGDNTSNLATKEI